MLNKILLPLDGSDVAEAVFPYGEELAKKLGSEIILFHVCVPEYRLARNMRRLYLEKTAELMQERLKKDHPKSIELKVHTEFIIGEFAKSACAYVAANDIGLVIMADHGFTSVRVKVVGGVTDSIFRLLDCPALLVRTGGAQPAKDKKDLFSRILLPLDGSSKDGEIALPFVAELSLKLKAKVSLFRMVNKNEQEGANSYLKSIERKLKHQGINATSSITLGDDPAKEITTAGNKADADVVVMATRSRLPINAWAPDSITHKLLNTGNLPLLVVRKTAEK